MEHQVIHLKTFEPMLGENGRDPLLHIYSSTVAPASKENQLRPAILICPGGAYLFCSKYEEEPVAFHYLAAGFSVFVLEYSVEPNRYPAQLREVAVALRWILENASRLQCDSLKIAIMGFSAGGHLVSHYVNACHTPAVTTVVSQAFLPQACVLCYPVVSTDPAIAHRNSFKYLLGQFPTDETAADFSTEKLVTANTPPTFIWSTAADENVPVANSLVYAEALARHNVPYEMHIYPCGIHGMSTVDDETNRKVDPLAACNAEWIAHSIRFLKEILKTPKERTL